MGKLADALRKKFSTPREAILALGLDESLLTERAYDSANPETKGRTMLKKDQLSRHATAAYGALTVFLKPQLAMDAKIDLAAPLRGVTAANFKARAPKITAAILKMVEGKLAMDGSIKSGLDEVMKMIDDMPKAKDEWPDKDEPEAEDEEMDDEGSMDSTDSEESETDVESDDRKKAEKEAKAAKDKKAKDKKAKDAKRAKDKADVNEEDEDHDPDMPRGAKDEDSDEEEGEKDKAMDAQIKMATDKAIKQERRRLEAISDAKDHVRSRVGNLSMAFDSARDVYLKAISMTGKDTAALKNADASTLRFVYDNLPAPQSNHRQTTMAQDSRNGGASDLATRNPDLVKNISRIGRA